MQLSVHSMRVSDSAYNVLFSASVDVDRIAHEMDFQALQQNIMNVTFCNIHSEVQCSCSLLLFLLHLLIHLNNLYHLLLYLFLLLLLLLFLSFTWVIFVTIKFPGFLQC